MEARRQRRLSSPLPPFCLSLPRQNLKVISLSFCRVIPQGPSSPSSLPPSIFLLPPLLFLTRGHYKSSFKVFLFFHLSPPAGPSSSILSITKSLNTACKHVSSTSPPPSLSLSKCVPFLRP